jgi:hypothetical protein
LNFLTADQLGGLVRAILATGGTWIIAKGYVTAADWEWLSGGVLTVAVGAWSWYAKKPAKAA